MFYHGFGAVLENGLMIVLRNGFQDGCGRFYDVLGFGAVL